MEAEVQGLEATWERRGIKAGGEGQAGWGGRCLETGGRYGSLEAGKAVGGDNRSLEVGVQE